MGLHTEWACLRGNTVYKFETIPSTRDYEICLLLSTFNGFNGVVEIDRVKRRWP